MGVRVQFRVINSKQPGAAYTVWKSPYIIGRHQDSDIRVVSKAVSVRHCAILLHEGGVWVRDLGSTNGTRVNGEPIHEDRQLDHGDKIWVGPAIIEVILSEAGSEPPAQEGSADYTATHVYGMDDLPIPPKGSHQLGPKPSPAPRKPR